MCKKFDIAKDTINEFVVNGRSFSFEEIQDEIIDKGGVLRIAPGITVGDYIENLEERRILFYNSFVDKYDYLEMNL